MNECMRSLYHLYPHSPTSHSGVGTQAVVFAAALTEDIFKKSNFTYKSEQSNTVIRDSFLGTYTEIQEASLK